MDILGRSVLALALPVAVFLAGGWAMSAASGRDRFRARTEAERPLNQRFGYDTKAVSRQWEALDAEGLRVERLTLELDLVFPFVYGGALAAGLLIAWTGLGRPFNAAWIIGLVAVVLCADWTENLLQLRQLARFSLLGASGLQPAWVAVASIATVTKLTSLGLAFVAILVMLGLTSSQRHDKALVRQPGDRRYGMPVPVAEVARGTWEPALFSADIYGRDWKDHAATPDSHPLLGGWSRCNDFISEHLFLEAGRQGLYVEVWRRVTPVETLVVTFKGTNPLTLRDWKSNARWFLRLVPWYRDQYTLLSEAFSREFADWVATTCGPNPWLIATGHSLGGGLAQHFAYSFPETTTRAGSAVRVSYVCAFDPSPVTGWSTTPEPTRLRNAQGLLIDRIFEHGEILAYLRLLLSYLLPPSAANPAIREVRVNFDWTDWPIRSHLVMDRLANELARAAGQRIA